MEKIVYNPLQLREVFHLKFLRWWGRKRQVKHYAVRGGANLRFFFNSFRYSEDIDLDICRLEVSVIKDIVMKYCRLHLFRIYSNQRNYRGEKLRESLQALSMIKHLR